MNTSTESPAADTVLSLPIEGMSCASCAARLERALGELPTVRSAAVNFASETATVELNAGAAVADVLVAIDKAGFHGRLPVADATDEQAEVERRERETAGRELRLLAMSAALTAPMIAQMIWMRLGVAWSIPGWAQLALATPVQFVAGARFYRGAYAALRARSGNMDLLVALGTTAAYLLSLGLLLTSSSAHLYFESSATVLTLVLLGKHLETRAKRSTTSAIRALMQLRPEEATVQRDGAEVRVPVGLVRRGDVVIVRPGERIPVDGEVIDGTSQIDESLVTGESMPVDKQPGAPVTGGSINGAGLLRVRATAVGEDSTLARIVAAVRGAQASKAPVQRLVDRVSAIFVPAVMAAAALTLVGWLIAGAGPVQAVIASVSVLVIACPCALGLATPTAIMVGTGAAARWGILIRDAEVLERARAVDAVVFDKTGTLTEGKPALTELLPAAEEGGERLLHVAASAQQGSEHPLARALLTAAASRGLTLAPVAGFESLPGRGLRAVVDGEQLRIGSRRLMAESGVDTAPLDAAAAAAEERGNTVMWVAKVARDQTAQLLGAIAVGDPVKPTSANAVRALRARGIHVALLTGDNRRSAGAVAEQVGIDSVIAEVLPEDKAEQVRSLQRQGRTVAMIGDGINDAPALAVADLGVAMGTGTDVALHTAGVALMRGEPTLVGAALEISRRTRDKIRHNLFWAFIYNVIGIPLAALGYLSPAVAGGAMALSSVSVVTNSLLLSRWRPAERRAESERA